MDDVSFVLYDVHACAVLSVCMCVACLANVLTTSPVIIENVADRSDVIRFYSRNNLLILRTSKQDGVYDNKTSVYVVVKNEREREKVSAPEPVCVCTRTYILVCVTIFFVYLQLAT